MSQHGGLDALEIQLSSLADLLQKRVSSPAVLKESHGQKVEEDGETPSDGAASAEFH